MEVTYYYIDPTKNITLLVESPVPEQFRAKVAKELMKAEPKSEQVGFVNGKNLNMAGGEFCGNATLSAAALYCKKNALSDFCGKISVSGADKPVSVKISENDGFYSGIVEMPEGADISQKSVCFGGKSYEVPVVKMPGITHIILTFEVRAKELEEKLPKLCKELGCNALGAMIVDENKNTLTPLVYVKASGTLFWESSCASGTTAVGIYLAQKYKRKIKESFLQPGGALGVEVIPGKAPLLFAGARIKYKKTIRIQFGI